MKRSTAFIRDTNTRFDPFAGSEMNDKTAKEHPEVPLPERSFATLRV
jgi:hypothetical protein